MRIVCFFALLFVISISNSFAGSQQEELKSYFNKIAQEVKAAETPDEKREILDKMFHKLLEASEYAEQWPLFSGEERASINVFKKKAEEKHDELNGYNGFAKVDDASLDRFADYTVQELEQAAEYITISVLTLVLIIILVAILL